MSRAFTPPSLSYQHWAGVSYYTSPYGFAVTCVFVKQSPEPFLCPPTSKLVRATFSRSYGSNLPNSLTKIFPYALVYSTCLPVMVYGTNFYNLARSVSCTLNHIQSFSEDNFPVIHIFLRKVLRNVCISHTFLVYYLDTNLIVLYISCAVTPLLITITKSSRILTAYPSPTPHSRGLGLGSTNPTLTDRA